MPSKSFGSQGASVPHLAKGGSQLDDLRKDVESGFTRNEARTDMPRIDHINRVTASRAASNIDTVLTGANFGTDSAAIVATLGGAALTVQVAPAGTTVTLRLAAGTSLPAVASTALLHMSVAGVAALPVGVEVVA